MAEPESLVLEQLRLIRDDMRSMRGEIDDLRREMRSDFGTVKSELVAHTGMLMALAGYIRDIDVRVEHLEERIGSQP